MTTTLQRSRQTDAVPVSRAEFDAALARIAALEAARPQKADEGKLMTTLLAAIKETWGCDVFMSEHVHEDANLRFITQRRSPRSIGKLLARHAGKTFDGLTLVAEPRIDRRRRWSVQRAG